MEVVISPQVDNGVLNRRNKSSMDIFSIQQRINSCQKCQLCAQRRQPVMGEGDIRNKIMLIGEAPGATEDELGRPFVGRSGNLLRQLMEEVGLTRENFFITNMVKCRPPENRKPTKEEIEACWPFLKEQIDELSPALVVTAGNTPTQWFLNTRKGVTALRGQFYTWTLEKKEMQIRPIFHPSYLLRNRSREKGRPIDLTLFDLREIATFL